MAKQAFVIVAPLLPSADEASTLLMIKLSVQHFVENLTDEKIRAGIVTWPEGEGDIFLLPALVPETKVLKGPWSAPTVGGVA